MRGFSEKRNFRDKQTGAIRGGAKARGAKPDETEKFLRKPVGSRSQGLDRCCRCGADGAVREDQIARCVDGRSNASSRFSASLAAMAGSAAVASGCAAWRHRGHRAEFIASLGDAFDLASRDCFAWWVQNHTAFILDPAFPPAFATSRELEEIGQFSLGVVAAHGVVDAFASTGTDISFAGVAAEHPLCSRTSRSTGSRRCFTRCFSPPNRLRDHRSTSQG
jgi:hypothetical protein